MNRKKAPLMGVSDAQLPLTACVQRSIKIAQTPHFGRASALLAIDFWREDDRGSIRA
jgi:hypothetical protein